MNLISVNDELPENNTLCWAYIPNRGIILRTYFKNDGFGLGDTDYEVAYWMEYIKPKKPDRIIFVHNPMGLDQDLASTALDYHALRDCLMV